MERKKITLKKGKLKPKLKAKLKFDPLVAKKMMNTRYYVAQSINIKQYEFLEKEKSKLATLPWEYVTNLLDLYKEKGHTIKSKIGKLLVGIYNKNKANVIKGKEVKNTQLLSILAKPEMLLLGYKAIKRNKGALTLGANVSKEQFNHPRAKNSIPKKSKIS